MTLMVIMISEVLRSNELWKKPKNLEIGSEERIVYKPSYLKTTTREYLVWIIILFLFTSLPSPIDTLIARGKAEIT